MKLLHLFILLALIFTACQKDEPTEVVVKGALARIKKGGMVLTEYAYLPSGQISSKRTSGTYTKYTYDSGGKLEKTETFVASPELTGGGYSPYGYGGYSPYGYSDNRQTSWVDPKKMMLSYRELYNYSTTKQLEQLTFKYEDYDTKTVSEFNYDAQGLIARRTVYYNNPASKSYIDYLYDETGNLKKASQYMIKPDGSAHLLMVIEYEFDRMRNPFLHFKNALTPGPESNDNNIIKGTFVRYDSISSNVVQNAVEQHFYEYNEQGYPVKMDSVYVFEYY